MTASDLDDIPLSLLRDRKRPTKDSEKTLDGSLQEPDDDEADDDNNSNNKNTRSGLPVFHNISAYYSPSAG